MTAAIDEAGLKVKVAEVLGHWPVAGLAVGVIRDGSLAWFHGHGVADLASGTPVNEDTVFPIASVTKTITTVAVMRLWERGLVDLDAPAGDYLRAYRLIPANPGFRPPTVRQLLTHTAGVRAVRNLVDLIRPTLGWGTRPGCPVPSLAQYYRDGLRIDVEPGTKWAYSNHGFATLGQIVEDVSGIPFGRYLRDEVFAPLGMKHSDLVRSERVRSRLATGYQLRPHGLAAVVDRAAGPAGGGSVCSTPGDMVRFAAALLGGGANEHGRVLNQGTIDTMFAPHYQPDPRIPGMGLGFFRDDAGGHPTVGHDGIWPGFHSAVMLAPADGIGVVAFSNTGPFGPLAAPRPVVNTVLRCLLGLPGDAVRTDIPEQPWAWRDLCGRYSLGPGLLTDPQPRMLGGAEVAVRRGHLTVSGQIPVPAVRRGLRLHPDGDDSDAFRVALPGFGSGTSPVVFGRAPSGEVTAMHLGIQPMTLGKRPHGGLATRADGPGCRGS
jgi:CubicO group peptidase (beta-lactamase class C family)